MTFDDLIMHVKGINMFSLGAYKSSNDNAFATICDNLDGLIVNMELFEKELPNGNSNNESTQENT